MRRHVQFVATSANDMRLVPPHEPKVDAVYAPPLGAPSRLVPPIDDEDDPELVKTLAALFWFKQQEVDHEE